MEFISLIGIVFAFFFAILVFNKKHKTIADKLLAVWLLLFGAVLINPFFIYSGIVHPKYGGSTVVLIPIVLALMYLYTRSLTTENFKLEYRHLVHTIPPIIFIISVIPYFMIQSDTRVEKVMHSSGSSWVMLLPGVTNIVIFFIYTLLSFLLVRKHQRIVNDSFSYHKNVDLQWLKNIISGLLLIAVSYFILIVIMGSKNIDGYTLTQIIHTLFTVLIIMIGYWGFKQGKIFVYMDPNISHQYLTRAKIQKEENPEASDNIDYTPMVEKITNYMESEKSFLDQELTLEKFANDVDISMYELSKILNNVLECNFYNFINRYRVEEFKKRVADAQYSNLTLLGIAYDCGFNSKASFNRIFKKFTNHTPSEYKKHVMDQHQ